MKLLFFFLSVACTTSYAVPTSLDNLKTLAVEHGNEVNPVPIPRDSLLGSFPKLNRHFLSSINPDSTGVYHTRDTGNTLSVRLNKADQDRSQPNTKNKAGTNAQNLLTERNNERNNSDRNSSCTSGNSDVYSGILSGILGSKIGNTQQERGDVKCEIVPVRRLAGLAPFTTPSNIRSSAAPTVQPTSAACPQRASKPECAPKVSMAEVYVRLLDTPRHFSVEPPPLLLNLKH